MHDKWELYTVTIGRHWYRPINFSNRFIWQRISKPELKHAIVWEGGEHLPFCG